MTTNNANEQNLCKCFEENIQLIQKAIDQIKSNKRLTNDILVSEPATDEYIYSFTLDQFEENLLINFKREFERILNGQIEKLEDYCRQFFLDALHQFKYADDKREFTEQFNTGMLEALTRELTGRFASIDAYKAAFNGDTQTVDGFLKIYPAAKDKPGLWGTTLLYSAAGRGHLELVTNLIEKHQCSVNAQNRHHILPASAGSTSLHSACYYGHLKVVEYLIDHGADYYIQNQAGETPFTYAKYNPTIFKYFQELLVFGYSSKMINIPERSIDDNGTVRTVDCFWEFKLFDSDEWVQFSQTESSQIQDSLTFESEENFQRQIYIDSGRDVYGICLMTFLRSGKNINYSEDVAWIRCRGSSFINFNCYALWQILLTKRPDTLPDPIFGMINIPTIYDSRFEFHLKTWYFANVQMNEQLDKAMKSRRRYVKIRVPLISDELLEFNLEDFSFTNHASTVQGHLRWVPKMISNNSTNHNEIIDIDEYATMTNINPIPLTTSRLKHVAEINEEILTEPKEDEDFSKENDEGPVLEVNFLQKSIHSSLYVSAT